MEIAVGFHIDKPHGELRLYANPKLCDSHASADSGTLVGYHLAVPAVTERKALVIAFSSTCISRGV